MRHRVIKDQGRTVLAAAVGAVLATFAGTAGAIEFEFGDGWSGDWNTTVQVSSSWRAEDNDLKLVTPGDAALIGISGGVASNGAVGGNLNWGKGDRFSTPFKVISDISISKGSFGLLVRGKAWYDDALENGKVRYGNQANGYNGFTLANYLAGGPHPRAELSDQGFEREQRFSGAMLLDAYVYDSFALGDTDLQVRLGNQVINWGESIFIQGVNQINPIDAVAARKPGAEVKEALLPVWAAYFNWGLGGGASLEAFYQFKWQNTSIEGCGMYWAQTTNNISSSAGACNMATSVMPGTSTVNPFAKATGLYAPLVDGKDAKDSGQYGLAFRFPVEKLDTEFGLYFENIHARTPVISGRSGTLPAAPILLPNGTLIALPPSAATGGGPAWFIPGTNTTLRNPAALHATLVPGVQPAQAYWEYPEDIKIFGLSAATNLFSWSVSAEASYTQDLPVQVNGNDLLFGMLAFIGPRAQLSKDATLKGVGTAIAGYDRFNKTQFQVNTVKVYSNVLGSTTSQLVGEVGFQWNNIPDYKTNARYGRGFMFGTGSHPTFANPISGSPPIADGNTCVPNPVLYQTQPNGCQNEGYVTDFSWGYRLRWQLEYSNVANSGIAIVPSIYWAHDVSGISPDPAFIADRQQLGLGLRFNYNKRYNLEFNYVQYNEGSKFDPLSDRDFYSAALNMTF